MKSTWAVKKVADLTLSASPLAVKISERRRQRRARHAIADGVDALDAEQVADRVDRVDLALRAHNRRGVASAMLSSADFQLTMNSEMPWSTHHLTKLFSGREVEDVEAVDPRREDHHRRLQHLVGRRRVLDQLVERRLLDHLARRRREVAPDLERAGLGLRQLPGRDVLEHVGEALEQVLAARFDRPLEHLRIGQREVRRAHRVDEAARREAQLLARLRRRRPRSRRPCRAAGRKSRR